MPYDHGRHFLAILGPSVIPDDVLRAMHRPAVNIYEGPLIDLTHSLYPDLKRIVGTKGEAFIYIANGHGAWEAALANVFSGGESVLVLESGMFAPGWGEIASRMGLEVETLSAPKRSGVDPNALEARLRGDVGHTIKAVLVVQIDTSSGVWNDIAAIRQAMDAAGHPALLMVDCIAATGCVPCEMDAWGVDVTVSACQKGLMTPPGLGIVFANERAMAKHRENGCRSSYWDWTPRANPERYYQLFAGTAPVQHLFGLRQALDMIFEEGLDAVYRRHRVIARGVRAAVEHWGSGGPFELNVIDPDARSDSVTTILTGDLDADEMRAICEADLDVTLGIGLGQTVNAFRIGHMGHINAPMMLGTLGSIELALTRMNAPFSPGAVEAAVASMAQ
ncbi:MAG: aminotransferase class V-fold PLP-dependent enzyme [Alphaproteobacteria bacterium]|nr:aminotransferase class V-fold PLP-dependent enzyme [Alphaproteobacteria bacterium]